MTEMSVCEFCRQSISRHDMGICNIARMSSAIEDELSELRGTQGLNSSTHYLPKMKVKTVKKEMTTSKKIVCPSTRCKYEWAYKGNGKFYATCPQCLNKIKITENLKGD